MEWGIQKIEALGRFLLSPENAFAPLYLIPTLGIACAIWLVRQDVRLIQFLFPREIYGHRSTAVDLKITVFNVIVIGAGLLSSIGLAPLFALLFAQLVPGETTAHLSVWTGIGIAFLLALGEDFARYTTHILHHKSKVLWPFHAVHHSAEVLSPLSYWRAHPAYFVVQRFCVSGIVGLLQAGALTLIMGHVEPWIFAAAAAFSSLYFIAGAHLRHSHIWVSYGPLVEHILISPAQHQIHHSTALEHRDKNFGEIFAIWDWLFGTLYIPRKRETLQFGLSDESGVPIEQPYNTLRQALFKPFSESFSALWWRLIKRPRAARSRRPRTVE